MTLHWLACELHTHTIHSDGSQTLEELATGAVKLGFDAIALTDHNTMSGLTGKEHIAQKHGLQIIPGMEWTTFYGHMVTVGLSSFADWREYDQSAIDEGIMAVHRLGGIAGLAHPFRIGSPACTGCYWEYEIKDWSAVNYIEVWSGTFAPIQTNNQRAYELWTNKLNEGYRIAATSGRDWHVQVDTAEPISVTYLGITDADVRDEANLVPADQFIHSLREGRASVTIGPLLTLTMDTGEQGEIYPIGSVIPADESAGELQAKVTLDFSVRPGHWALSHQVCKLKLCSNLGNEHNVDVTYTTDIPQIELDLNILPNVTHPRTWIRAELWGNVQGVYTLIAFTNAIYFEEGER